MGNLYLIRHGETVANAQNIIQGPRIDAELSELGIRQASRMAVAFQETHLDAIFSSPLARARSTAEALQAGRDIAVQVVPELYELDFGNFCGQTWDGVSNQVAQVVDAWNQGFLNTSYPGGESAVVAQTRINPFVKRALEEAKTRDIAIVAHGRLNRILLATMLGQPMTQLRNYPQDNANISHLEIGKDVVVKRLNDTTHLAEDARPGATGY